MPSRRLAIDLGAPFSFVDLYRGYACYAEISAAGFLYGHQKLTC